MFIAGVGGAACSSGGMRPPTGGPDAAVPSMDASAAPADAATSDHDASITIDSGTRDLASVGADLAQPPAADLASPPAADLAAPAVDMSAPAVDLAIAADLAYPSSQNVDIYVDNTCNMDVIPKVFNVPRGTTLSITNYNRSHDYPVTVWMSYGGGYTDLATGGVWADPIPHCRLPRPYDEYADISTACSSYRLMIHCL
jgi:hypothetical protein